MVLIKNTACVVLVFLSAAWLSTARMNPKSVAVSEISYIKATIAFSVPKSTTVKSLAAIDEGNLNKLSEKLLMSKSGKVISAPILL
ncbi:hypothetical protein GLYMA_01G067700v4 [Glycine max]|uniref:Uncharacterized protein n=1 Tax=Glycine max TaxID=3847 RepID=K7K2A2_SOYBN|nr:hypothetical protein GYH30_000716 [Glycine max]KAH1161958.1 hypothetical protein GYH30_000716 [Glycine max]KRH75178.1 hypothetical protein GLYMA_01G067700v4 [Glycine max]KRH75179.1 hypothetical protein GLYMA_01G067700v4 [Glycine max]